MSNPEMSQYLGVFLDEGQEQLDLFETHVIGLERSPDPDAELQILFRAAHTLKGSSKAMGFVTIGDLTHEMENVLDALRAHQIELSSAVIDFLLEGMDMLKGLMQSVATDGTEGAIDSAKMKQMSGALDKFRGTAPKEEALKEEAATKSSLASTGIVIRIRIADDCPMKGIRVLLILGALNGLGTITATSPSEEDLEAEKFENDFEVAIDTDRSASEVAEAVTRIMDVVSAEIDDHRTQAAEPKAGAPAPPAGAATTEAAQAAPAAAATAAASTSSTVRVDVGRLDKLLNLVGELVTDRTQLVTLTAALHGRYADDEQLESLLEGINRFGRVTSELQEEVMKSRMLPINGVFQRMPRMVRDLAQKTNKELDFEMTGGETELDRSVLEILGDPLIHLLRNAVDHGVEVPEARIAKAKPARGKVLLSARQERSQIVIEIEDDGNGIDPAVMRSVAVSKGVISESVAESLSDREAINLIFSPGLTTAKTLSEISGRGVGMDIVRSNIERVGGRILIESKIGIGSRFMIYLPLTLAIVRAVLISAEKSTYAIPLTSVTEMVSLVHDNGELVQTSAGGQAALMLRGKTLPLANFADVLRADQSAVEPRRVKQNSYAVVIRHGDGEAALSVDALQGEMEVVIKPLGSLLKDIPGVSGASILGDGRVALVVDPSKALEELYRSQIAA